MSDIPPAPDSALVAMWEKHLFSEFGLKNADEALLTMTENPSVLCVPVLRGGTGRGGVRKFYAEEFLSDLPPDISIQAIARTVSPGRIIDEMVVTFSHSVRMEWMLPGLAPTGRTVTLALVAAVDFEGDKVARERIYWDQGSLLVQLGLIDPKVVPAYGAEAAKKLLGAAPR